MQVDGEVILAALRSGQLGPLGVTAELLRMQIVRESSCSVGDVGPCEASITKDQTEFGGASGGDCFVNIAHVEVDMAGTHGLAR